ncbi:hypothetical protein GRX03_09355 [Halovenus sp. WSH3]|uniref:Uncharacterized protein n=1 Tax=Halovenus carboxidivorans TaxID=2692199 RepID=A0A6B0TAA1_9EURY|nr:hypothetical protein [Halovenus carboxidivorans]MXR51810.1 hypothetical protein [Halovenus carboxidivorans]
MSKTSDAIQHFDGVTPRVVANLSNTSFDIEYVRDDVEGEYSDDEFDEAYQLIMANHVTGEDFKELIGEGEFNAQTLFFDDIIAFFFPSDRYEGIFASFDYDESFPVSEFVEYVSGSRTDDQ